MTGPAAGEPRGAISRSDLARWVLCCAAVLALHGGAALAVLGHSDEEEAAGFPAAIPIELAPLPAAPSAEPTQDAAPGPEQVQSEPSPSEAADAQPPPAPEPPQEVPPEPVQTAAAPPDEPPPEPAPVVPDLTPAPKPEVALAPPPETQKPERRKPEPRTRQKPREKPVEKTKPREKPAERQERREEAKERQERRERARVASAAATTAPASARSVAARAAAPMGNAGTSSSLPEWKVRLAAHLQRHKRYPSEAQAAGKEGVATLQFTVDRSGRVTSSRLVRSSGVPALDAETLALIRRAQPLPPPPADVPGAHFSFSVPFRYSMR